MGDTISGFVGKGIALTGETEELLTELFRAGRVEDFKDDLATLAMLVEVR
jgi:hypothetical protein